MSSLLSTASTAQPTQTTAISDTTSTNVTNRVLTTGAKAGIGVAVGIAFIVLLVGVWCLFFRPKRKFAAEYPYVPPPSGPVGVRLTIPGPKIPRQQQQPQPPFPQPAIIHNPQPHGIPLSSPISPGPGPRVSPEIPAPEPVEMSAGLDAQVSPPPPPPQPQAQSQSQAQVGSGSSLYEPHAPARASQSDTDVEDDSEHTNQPLSHNPPRQPPTETSPVAPAGQHTTNPPTFEDEEREIAEELRLHQLAQLEEERRRLDERISQVRNQGPS